MSSVHQIRAVQHFAPYEESATSIRTRIFELQVVDNDFSAKNNANTISKHVS